MPRFAWFSLLAASFVLGTGAMPVAAQISTLSGFQDCIGANGASLGYSTTCELSAAGSPYLVTTPLIIGRSGIVVTGSSLSSTVLRRNSSSLAVILKASSAAITNVTVSHLTLDGNRYGVGLSCLTTQLNIFDMDLALGGIFTVQWVDFVNAPDTALRLGGTSVGSSGSSVSFSNFGQSGTSSATRFTAMYLSQNAGAYYNAVAFAGTAGITLDGNSQVVYGNLLSRNRYELSDGHGGGQITLWHNADDARIGGNVINGDYWPPSASFSVASGCSTPTSLEYNNGIEASGHGNAFYNNEVEQHTGAGMSLNLDSPNTTGDVTISSANPWYSSDTPRYVEANQGGIVVLGPPRTDGLGNYFPVVTGVTLDDVLVRNNGQSGVYLYNTQNSSGFYGFANGSCMSGNTSGDVYTQFTSPWNASPYSPLTNQAPSSTSSYHGGACPNPGWAVQTPAPSGWAPTWPW